MKSVFEKILLIVLAVCVLMEVMYAFIEFDLVDFRLRERPWLIETFTMLLSISFVASATIHVFCIYKFFKIEKVILILALSPIALIYLAFFVEMEEFFNTNLLLNVCLLQLLFNVAMIVRYRKIIKLQNHEKTS